MSGMPKRHFTEPWTFFDKERRQIKKRDTRNDVFVKKLSPVYIFFVGRNPQSKATEVSPGRLLSSSAFPLGICGEYVTPGHPHCDQARGLVIHMMNGLSCMDCATSKITSAGLRWEQKIIDQELIILELGDGHR